MKSTLRPHHALVLYPISAAVSAVYLLSIPSDPKNSFWLGLSRERWVLFAILLIAFFACLSATLWAWHNPQAAQRRAQRLAQNRLFQIGSGIFLAAGWIGLWLPAYRLGYAGAAFERLRPLILFLFLASLLNILFLVKSRRGFHWKTLGAEIQSHKPLWVGASVSLLVMLAFWLSILLSGKGLRSDMDFWNTAAIPLLGLQFLLAAGLGLTTYFLVQRLEKKPKPWIDWAIALVIWLGAFLFWQLTPMPPTFFAPNPQPPTYQYYPFSDAAGYDESAQYALLGEGYQNGGYVDKPLYTALLTLFHLAGGQDFDHFILFQVLLLALFPALVYWIGKTLANRPAGVIAALLLILQEMNAIQAATWAEGSHVKLLLSEMPTGLLLAFFTYFLFKWLQEPKHNFQYAMLAGGSLGLSTMVRHNPWIFLPYTIGIAFFFYWKSWRKWLLACSLFVLVMGLAIGPWTMRYHNQTGRYFAVLAGLDWVVWQHRYLPGMASPTPTLAVSAIPGAALSTATPESRPTPQAGPTVSVVTAPEAAPSKDNRLVKAAGAAIEHFLHNCVTSLLILPVDPLWNDLSHTIQQPDSPWQTNWSGALGWPEALLLLANLVLLALGIGSAWERWKFAGLLPLGTFLVYQAGLAVARTSGGRYIVPTHWLILLYVALGVTQVFVLAAVWLGKKQDPVALEPERPTMLWKKILVQGIAAALVFFGIGWGVTNLDKLFKPKYPDLTSQEVLEQVISDEMLSTAGYSRVQLQNFIEQQSGVILYGSGIYPRYYYINGGEPNRNSFYTILPYPRLAFTFLTPHSSQGVLLVHGPELDFEHTGSYIVIGCNNAQVKALDALLIIETDPETQVLKRQPAADLVCPVPQPVCDNNSICK